MQIKINGEAPFQVLGTNFTIGPSTSGYDLMFSADGFNYSKLFTVGADTNRQVTQVAAGSYYYLAGNTDEVTVNWMKDCGGGDSGGGSYTLPIASQNTLGGIKVGSGLSIDGNGVLSANGGGGSGAQVVLLNKLTQQERLDLYSAITACYDYETNSFTSAWTENAYAFYIDLREYSEQENYGTNDNYEGFFPMEVARVHPDDYGGCIFFTGIQNSRVGEAHIINIRYVITYEGGEEHGTWWNIPTPGYADGIIRIDSTGTINANDSDLWGLSTLSNFSRFRIQHSGDNNIFHDGTLLSFSRRMEQVEGYEEEKLMEYICGLCDIGGNTLMKGTWHFIEGEWGDYVTPDTWTTA